MEGGLRVGILGTGKLGTDLLIKTLRSTHMHCLMFSGRNGDSEGMRKAQSLNVATSTQSVDAFDGLDLDLVFDVTSAEHHKEHAGIFAALGVKAIDLTPAKVGRFCVPSINPEIIESEDNINLVTCGGQSAIPLVACLSKVFPYIDSIEMHSHLAEDSVGPGTLANLDDYYLTTAMAIREYSGIQNVSVDLSVEKSGWKPDMLTTIRAQVHDCNIENLYAPLMEKLELVRRYVPGYHIVGTPSYRDSCIEIAVSVRGLGDWIPAHAGNLDIINCAAIAVAERYSQFMRPGQEPRSKGLNFGSLLGRFARKTEPVASAEG